jgi:hypothetical protein
MIAMPANMRAYPVITGKDAEKFLCIKEKNEKLLQEKAEKAAQLIKEKTINPDKYK